MMAPAVGFVQPTVKPKPLLIDTGVSPRDPPMLVCGQMKTMLVVVTAAAAHRVKFVVTREAHEVTASAQAPKIIFVKAVPPLPIVSVVPEVDIFPALTLARDAASLNSFVLVTESVASLVVSTAPLARLPESTAP